MCLDYMWLLQFMIPLNELMFNIVARWEGSSSFPKSRKMNLGTCDMIQDMEKEQANFCYTCFFSFLTSLYSLLVQEVFYPFKP